MATTIQRIPEGFHTLTPHIIVKGAADALEFYKRAFGAEEIYRMSGPDGTSVMHAELQIGTSRMFICEEFPDMAAQGPQALGGSPVTLHLYVENVDKSFERAVEAGGEVTMPVKDQFWGDRYGKLKDPFGHHWSLASHVEDVAPEEIRKRAAAAFGGECCG